MRNTLMDLNNALFEELENLQNAENADEMDRAITRSAAVAKIGETIVKNAELALKVTQHMNEYCYGADNKRQPVLAAIPEMLVTNK